MSELSGVFEEGEYGYRGGMSPRIWHNEFMKEREALIRDHKDGQYIFKLSAGTGSGKTCAAGMAASDDLNLGRVRRVVVCVPSIAIAAGVREVFRANFGIHLAHYNARKYPNGVTSDQQGYILPYQAMARQPLRHRRISTYEPTLVIFDEIHHLGDGESWGDASKLAFGSVPSILTMTGSPIRPPHSPVIPFAEYVATDSGNLRYKADYLYPLGRAIVDGYCREPDFRFSDDVRFNVRPPGSDREFTIGLADNLSERMAQETLSAAVQYGSLSRHNLLKRALGDIRRDGRKCAIFLGGDTAENEKPTTDATVLLPKELRELGYGHEEYMSLTMRDKKPHEKVRMFLESPTAWILGSVNMLSEGVDTPEISAEIFLTTWVTDLSAIQRWGRALRFMNNGDPRDAWFYLFHHPSYARCAADIKKEWDDQLVLQRQRREAGIPSAEGPRARTEIMAISGGDVTYAIWNGKKYPYEIFNKGLLYLKERNLSKVYLGDVLTQMKEEQNVHGNGAKQHV